MDETMELIQTLSTERFQLYLAAGHRQLSPDQKARLNELNNELPVLWDRYRREFADQVWRRERGAEKLPKRTAA